MVRHEDISKKNVQTSLGHKRFVMAHEEQIVGTCNYHPPAQMAQSWRVT
jgi:hypothetical protein